MSGLGVKLTADISAYEKAMARARDLAIRHSADIAGAFAGVSGKIDASFGGLVNGPGMSALARLPGLARNAAAGFIAFEAVKFALNQVDQAAKAAQERLQALVAIGAKAQGAGVGTTFLQSWTQQAKELNTEAGKLEAMLTRAREASTVRIGAGELAATSTMIDRLRQNVAAGNIDRASLDRFTGAADQEARIRVILDLIEQLRAKGAQLAAFDLGGQMFGPEFENQLRSGVDMVGKMRASLDGLNVAGGARVIPPEEVQRAAEINAQLERARDIFTNALRPIQEDMAAWQQQQLAGYADFATMTAGWAAALSSVYEQFRQIGGIINQIGNADVFKRAFEFAKEHGLANMEGVKELTDADRKPLAVTVKPSGIAPKADTSKPLPSLRVPKASSVGATPTVDDDGVERLIRRLKEASEQLEAEVTNFGKSTVEREKSTAIIKAEAQAREDVARGKRDSASLDDDERQRILATAEATGQLKDKLQGLREGQEAWKEFGSTMSDAFKQAIVEGKSLSDVVSGLMKKLEGRAIDAVFASIFSPSSTGTGGSAGIFGGIGKLFGFADGGTVYGPGTGRSDSILARLSAGEFVVNARSAGQNRDLLHAINNNRVPAFATGGIVGRPAFPAGIAGGGSTPQSITIAPSVTVNASGGTPTQNSDLATQTAKHVENSVRQIVQQELQTQMRPGGVLR